MEEQAFRQHRRDARLRARRRRHGRPEDSALEYVVGKSGISISKWRNNTALVKHAKKHASDFGIDYRSSEGQRAYGERCALIVKDCDSYAIAHDMAGQGSDECMIATRMSMLPWSICLSGFSSRDLERERGSAGIMTVFRTRYESDTKGEFGQYVIDSVTLANDALSGKGKRFYLDSVDVEQKEIGGFFCWDMCGWVVDESDSAAFEDLWIKEKDSELDGFDYAMVTWDDDGGSPVPVFDTE